MVCLTHKSDMFFKFLMTSREELPLYIPVIRLYI